MHTWDAMVLYESDSFSVPILGHGHFSSLGSGRIGRDLSLSGA
jgi:hypothetical protein